MENPIGMAFGAAATVVHNKIFGKLTAKVIVESSTLEATTFKPGIEPPHVVAPVVEYGEKLTGVVELTSPPGETLFFGGLTVSIRVSKLVKHGGEPVITEEMKELPTWMHPKATPIVHAYDFPICESVSYVVLEPGHYPVDGVIRVPFSIPTDALPALESFDAGDGSGLCHWVEANIGSVGWRSKVQYMSEGWSWMQKNGAKNRAYMKKKGGASAMFANMNNQGASVEGAFFQPGGKRGDPFQRLVMQVVSPPTPQAIIYQPEKPEKESSDEKKKGSGDKAQPMSVLQQIITGASPSLSVRVTTVQRV